MAQPLQLRFATDVEGAKRGVANLAASVASNMVTVQQSIQNGATAIAGFNRAVGLLPTSLAAITAIGAAFAGFALASSAIDQAKERIERYVELLKSAEQAQVGVELFQRFVNGAKAAKIEVADFEDALSKALKASTERFNQGSSIGNKLGEFSTGLDRVIAPGSQGYQDFLGAKTQEDRIRAVLAIMQEVLRSGRELAALDIGETMFGSKFVDNLREGKITITSLLSRLDQQNPKNLVAEEDAIRAKDLSDRLEDAKTRLSEALGYSISLASAGQALLSVWTSIVEKVADFAETLKGLNIPWERILNNAGVVGKGILLEGQVLGAVGRAATQPGADLAALSRQARQDLAGGINPTGYSQADLSARDQFPGAPGPTRRPPQDVLFPKKTSERESLTAVEAYVNAVERAADLAKAEFDNVKSTNVQREQALALVRAEAAAKADYQRNARDTAQLTEEEKNKILAAAAATAEWRDKAADLNQVLRQNAETMRYFGNLAADALGDMIIDGKKASDVLRDLTNQLLRAILQASFTGQGPLAGLLGLSPAASAGPNGVGGIGGILQSLLRGFGGGGGYFGNSGYVNALPFGGPRAAGGPVSAGRYYMVGEHGPELVRFGRDGMVIPNVSGPTAPMASPVINNISVVGAPAGAEVESQRNPSGGIDLKVIIQQAAAQGLEAPGNPMSMALKRSYGAEQALTVR